MILTRADILNVVDISTETVSVPEWGGEVFVRGLTGAERDEYEASFVEAHGKKQVLSLENVRARLVVYGIVDDKGERVFRLKDVEALGKKSASALDRVAEVIRHLSGLSPKDIEELAGNLL